MFGARGRGIWGVNMPVWGVIAVVKLCLRWGFSARFGLGRPIFDDFFWFF